MFLIHYHAQNLESCDPYLRDPWSPQFICCQASTTRLLVLMLHVEVFVVLNFISQGYFILFIYYYFTDAIVFVFHRHSISLKYIIRIGTKSA